ncbi:ABC transporter ATP-binding protein [Microbacterium sp. CH-015]|uniref:ABC transporter ATP-binding protein n=1 Tax=Microbacterium sp. CH-015 TaxID=3406734 RepID=UPI003C77A52A
MSSVFPVASGAAVRQRIGGIVRAESRALTLIVALFALAAVAGLVPPWVVGRLIDRLISGADAAEVSLLGALMIASVAAQALAVLVATRLTMVLGERVFAELREDFIADVLYLPVGAIEEGGTGELVNRTTQDVAAVSSTVRFALPQILIASVTIALTVVAGFVVSPLIAPVFLLAAPILVVLVRWLLARATPVYLAEGAAYGPIFGAASETVAGARTVDALSLADARDAQTDEAIAGFWRATVPVIHLQLVFLPWSNVAFAIPVAAALVWGGWLATQGIVTVGAVVSVTLFATQLVTPLETLMRWLDELQHGFAAFARVLGVSELREEPAEAAAAPTSATLRLDDVRFGYRADREVLHGVSLETVPGERLAVVGSSGAGKSTIARLLAGIDAPTSGRVTVGDVDVTALALEARRHEVLLVSQESHVFAASVADNLLLGRETATDAELLDALVQVGADAWVQSLENGIETTIGAGGAVLSGAQEQQLALARIVVADPHTLILDEATSLLDPTAARAVESALAAALRGRTVIAIAHRLHTAYDADRVAVVEGGLIVELGSHDELLQAGGRYAALWHSWRDDGAADDARDPHGKNADA